MARRRKGLPVSGWLVLDKPTGMTSAHAVAKVKRTLNAQKAGHAGTLDPRATGILPIALGEATKLVPYLMDDRKVYRFTVRWGQSTTSDDAEGEVLAESPVRPDRAAIEAVLPRFTGWIDQVPPSVSAIKVNGQRAYDLARDNRPVELEARQVLVERLELLETADADHATFEAECGKGTYMRGLARDLGTALGTLGHVSELRRTMVGPFAEDSAISLDSLIELGHSPAAFEHVLAVETALDDIPALALTEAEAARIRQGQAVSLLARSNRERVRQLRNGGLLTAMAGEKLVAVARLEAGEVHPVRVLNL